MTPENKKAALASGSLLEFFPSYHSLFWIVNLHSWHLAKYATVFRDDAKDTAIFNCHKANEFAGFKSVVVHTQY